MFGRQPEAYGTNRFQDAVNISYRKAFLTLGVGAGEPMKDRKMGMGNREASCIASRVFRSEELEKA